MGFGAAGAFSCFSGVITEEIVGTVGLLIWVSSMCL